MKFSIIIPTYNRSEKLSACLAALFAQNFDKKQFEIIVVDDGSTDFTQSVLRGIQKNSPVPLQSIHQENHGQGVARNAALKQAHGEVVVLIGDDIIALPDLLNRHNAVHEEHPEEHNAVLGFVTWHPRLPVTALMRFMEQGGAILGRWGGHQFAYDLLEGKKTADYRFFYTANISLKRSLLQRFPFDPSFSGYGWEDIELGYRLTKEAGLVLHYSASAMAYHDHSIDEHAWKNRMREIGRSSHLFDKKYPELKKIPTPSKKAVLKLLTNPLFISSIKPFSKNFYFYALSKKYFLEGVEEGYNKRQV